MGKLTTNKSRYLYKNWTQDNWPTSNENLIIFRYHRLFFGSLIQRGRKLWALKFFVNLKYRLKKNLLMDPNLIFHASILKITPYIFLTKKKIGKVIYGVPVYIGYNKQLIFGVKLVIKLLRDRFKKLTLSDVSDTMIGALFNKGLSFEEKKQIYKVAEENRHLLRYMKR